MKKNSFIFNGEDWGKIVGQRAHALTAKDQHGSAGSARVTGFPVHGYRYGSVLPNLGKPVVPAPNPPSKLVVMHLQASILLPFCLR